LNNSVKEVIKEKIINALRNVYDPEIPVNVFDLGLIYEITVTDNLEVVVKYTLTAPGCPLASFLDAQIIQAIKNAAPEAKEIKTELVFDPPWSPLKVTREGREQLKLLYGYDVVGEWLRRMGVTENEQSQS